MKPTTHAHRRGLFTASGAAVAAVTGFALVSLSLASTAAAAPDPCSASEVAQTIGAVATSTGSYLEANPDTDEALTVIWQQQAGSESLGAVKAYFDANPEVAKDIERLQQPLVVLSSRCRMPLTLPQLMGVMQAAQTPGGAAGGLPGAARAVGLPSTELPTQSSPASAVLQGNGPLPGPQTGSTR